MRARWKSARHVKTLQNHIRPLTQKELKALKKIRNSREKEIQRGFRVRQALTSVLLGAAVMYGAVWSRFDLITFILGVLALFCLAYAVIQPYERFKEIRKARRTINKVEAILNAGKVEVTPVKAKRIAVAKEYEDEGDLYIVEMENSQVLYLWDTEYNLHKNFPCLEFEIYEDEFFNVIGRQINPLSEKIKPVVIPEESKWNYLGKTDPQHMEVERKNFDKLVDKMSQMA